LEDAITLQEKTYDGTTRVLKVFDEETGTDKLGRVRVSTNMVHDSQELMMTARSLLLLGV